MSGIPGRAPNPKDIPSGCRYSPRCPVGDEQCATVAPDLEGAGGDHTAACHYPERSRADIPLHFGLEEE